jgi:crossover junction endodeoxyribonuclease RusA
MLTFHVYGDPIGQGRLSAVSHGKKTDKGRVPARVVHSNAKTLKPWREAIAARAKESITTRDLAEWFPIAAPTPVSLLVVATMPCPQAAIKEGRHYPAVKSPRNSDIDHLARAVSDALSGIVYADDVQIIELMVGKTFPVGKTPHPHSLALPHPGVHISVCPLMDGEAAALWEPGEPEC